MCDNWKLKEEKARHSFLSLLRNFFQIASPFEREYDDDDRESQFNCDKRELEPDVLRRLCRLSIAH